MFERFKGIDKYIGIFIIGCIIILIVVISTMGIKKRWLTQKVPYKINLTETMGLREGTLVNILGMDVGEVTSLDLTTSDTIDVKFYIEKKYQSRIRQGTSVDITSPNIIGSKILKINPGPKGAKLIKPKSYIPANVVSGILEIVSKKGELSKMFDEVTDAVYKVKGIMDSLVAVIAVADTAFNAFNRASDNLDQSVVLIRNQQNSFGKLLHDKGVLFKKLDKSVSAIEDLTTALSRRKNKYLKNVDTILNDMKDMIKDLKGVSDEVKVAAPEIPKLLKLLEKTANEARVLFKAMQKHWLIKKYIDKDKVK